MAQKSNQGKRKITGKQNISWAPDMPFGKINYILLVAGIVVLAIGYILLSGGGSDDPNVFNYDIFNTRRLTIAPIVLVLGFLIEFAAIFFKVKSEPTSTEK
jgi:hypothetical protein